MTATGNDGSGDQKRVKKSDAEWRRQLTEEAYHVTREHGTERSFSHPYHDDKSQGMFRCVCCDAELFRGSDKYDSGTGWPSFFQPASQDSLTEHVDRKLLRQRTEVRCAACDAHLGHVFPDGPDPTGLRYCINGVALDLKPEKT